MPEHHRIAIFRIVHGEHTPDGDTLNWEARPDTRPRKLGKCRTSAHMLFVSGICCCSPACALSLSGFAVCTWPLPSEAANKLFCSAWAPDEHQHRPSRQ